MNTEEAFGILKEDFVHSSRGKDALDAIEKEFRELKEFREYWLESIARAYEKPHVVIEA